MALPSSKLTWLAGKSLFSVGNTSSNSASSTCYVSLPECNTVTNMFFIFHLPFEKSTSFWDLLICSVWDFNEKNMQNFILPRNLTWNLKSWWFPRGTSFSGDFLSGETMLNFGGVMTLGMSCQSSTSWGFWRSHLRHLYDESPQGPDNHRIRLGGSETEISVSWGKFVSWFL